MSTFKQPITVTLTEDMALNIRDWLQELQDECYREDPKSYKKIIHAQDAAMIEIARQIEEQHAANDERKAKRKASEKLKKIRTKKPIHYENEFIAFSAELSAGHPVRVTCSLSDLEIVSRDNNTSYSVEMHGPTLTNIEFEDIY